MTPASSPESVPPARSASRQNAIVGICASAVLACLAPVAQADCAQIERKQREQTDRVGAFDIVLTAQAVSRCAGPGGKKARDEQLSQLRMSLDRRLLDAEYRWSREGDGLKERHGLTFTALEHRELLMRAHAEREIDLSTGKHGSRVKLENGFNVGSIRSTATLVREAASQQRMTGVDLGAVGALPVSGLSAQVRHGEWRVRDAASGANSKQRSGVSFEYNHGAARINSGYARKSSTLTGVRHVFAGGATFSRSGAGTYRDSATLTAEVAKTSGGRAAQSLGLGFSRGSRDQSRSVKVDFAQSESGLRQTKLSFARSARGAVSIESSVAYKSGCVDPEAALTLAAKYRF